MADYAISNVARRVVYTNTGVGPYAFTFEILANTDIAVYRGSTLLTLTTDYSVTINANGTGSVTLVTAGTGNITIVGARAIQRTSDYTTGGDLFASTLNTDLDSQTIYVQQVAETAERGLKAPVIDPTDINMTLPSKASRANKYLVFDANGNPTAGDAASDIALIASISDEIVTVSGISSNVTTVAGISANITSVAGNSTNINTVATNNANVTAVGSNIAKVTTVADDLNEPVSEINTVATNITNVNAVGNNITAVNAVYANEDNINAVDANATNINTVATNIANVNSVGSAIANVNTVATDIAAITTVASDLNEPVSEIDTVATNITNVNNVGSNISNVNTVAGNGTNINTVAGISANVTTVAGISANVTTVAGSTGAIGTVATNLNGTNTIGTVAGIDADVTTVAGISANVTSVAGNSANINTVATNIANVNTVGTNIANVNAVGTNIANVNAVNSNSTNINTVAGNNANITTVAGVSSDVTAVATNNVNVTTVAGSIASVNTNATNIANINQNAANIVAIQNASTNATNAANSATAAASSATSASASAAAASAVALGNEPVRHSVRPSLLLDFANTKTLDPRITFTRGSTATFYDGKTVAKAEENLLLRSQEFETTGVWSLGIGASRTANTSTAPDGTTTADTITEDSAASIHNIVQNATSAGQITFSVFAKAGSGSRFLTISVSRASTHYGSATFNLATQTATQTLIAGYSGSVTTTVTASTQGFFRYSITLTTDTVSDVRIGLSATSTFSNVSRGFDSYTGDGASSIILWGAQLEQRSSVTAYTATTTAPITNYIPALQTAAANVARFDHNPVTGESLGLEIEEQRTNLLTYSDDFADAAWTKTRSSITNNIIVAPDGTLTGDKFVEDTSASNTHIVSRVVITTAAAHTMSFYAKAAERTFVRGLLFDGTNFYTAYFDLTNGTVGTLTGTGTSASITSVGNGWYRCVVTATTAASSSSQVVIRTATANGTDSYTGDGYSGIYIWGAQLEAGAFATSYIPTVASTVTRSADNASMTGTNFSSWYRADEGTLYADTQLISNSGSRVAWDIGPNAAFGNTVYQSQGQTAITITSGNATLGVTITGNTALLSNKTATAIKLNDYALSVNGATVVTDTSAFVPVNATQLVLGHAVWAGNGTQLNGTLRKIAYYPRRLTNAELQGLTTV